MTDKDLKDSGKRQSFDSGCVRDTAENKSRPDLISPYFMMRVGVHLEKGARKYDERNWEKGMSISRCIASLERHLQQYKLGQTDEDHLAAIGCNNMFIIHYEELIKRGKLPAELNDMPFYESGPENEKISEDCVANITGDGSFIVCDCKVCRAKGRKDIILQAGQSAIKKARDFNPTRNVGRLGKSDCRQ